MPLLSLTLTADRTATALRDTITYTITYTIAIRNTSIVPAADVVVTVPAAAGTLFVLGSVSVGGVLLSGANPAAGIPVGVIPPGGVAEAAYRVQVIAVNDPPAVVSTASAAAAFQPIPEGPAQFEQTSAATLVIPERFAALSGVKTSDLASAIVGDIVTYTFQVANSGNAAAANAVLRDSIPAGTSMVPGSILVNNLPQLGSNPAAIDLGDIAPDSTVTVSFEVHINALPNTLQLINQAAILSDIVLPPPAQPVAQPPVPIPPNVIQMFDPSLHAVKQANRSVTAVGDTVTYSVTVTNSGNTSLSSITVADSPPAGTQFVLGSVTVSGAAQSEANPLSGIAIGLLSPGHSVIVAYQFRVVTAVSSIRNQAAVSFMPVLPGRALPQLTKRTTPVTIPVLNPNLDIIKRADLTEAELGGIITYTIIAANSGNTDLSSVIVTDPLPSGTLFVAGSVKVNGTAALAADPSAGINTGSLTPGQSATVTHQVRVITDDSNIVNQAQAAFTPDITGLTLPPRSKTSNQIVIPVIEEEE